MWAICIANRSKSDRRSTLEDKAHPQEDFSLHQGAPHGGDRSSDGSCERPRRAGILRSLRLPHSGAATMKGAVGLLSNRSWGHVLIGSLSLQRAVTPVEAGSEEDRTSTPSSSPSA